RMAKNMRLQTDPTIIYGLLPEFDGNIRREDIRSPHPWNTYVHRGLPPTPIAMVGREAIHAAMNPKPGDSLYFVAKGDGSHHFSKTLEEHNRAVRKYQLNR
ncbi:MAG: endolytic transglycosylase MltG, partial [Kangiella sp.]|nr:endolytic transglycosylase MltG [Kangiella sp.]